MDFPHEEGVADHRYMHEGWYQTTLHYRQRDTADNHSSPPPPGGNPNAAFRYCPLDNSASQFRLLVLLPAEAFDAPLEARLMTCSLDLPPPRYECLSYVWGKPEFTQAMQVDDDQQHFFITANLSNILRYLRPTPALGPARLLWVDAVCINQCDTLERSAQVLRMRDIYGSCERDLVWVGPYDLLESWPPCRNALDVLRHGMAIMKQIESFRKEFVTGPTTEGGAVEVSQLNDRWRARLTRDCPSNDIYIGRQKPRDGELYLNHEEREVLEAVLLHSPVWGRIWVMQEVSVAPRLVLVAGHQTMDWEIVQAFLGDSEYADVFHAPFHHDAVESLVKKVFAKAQAIEHQRGIVRDMKRGHYVSTLLDVLGRFRDAKATDPRDKIYGLLGLVNEDHTISVDYGKSPEEVFTDVAIFMINRYGNLDILCQSPWSDLVYRMPGLPSWVPDFTCPGHPIPLFAQRSIFNAGHANLREAPCEVIRDDDDDGRAGLLVSGVFIDRVGAILPEGDYSDENYKLEHKYSDRDGHFLDREYATDRVPRDWMLLYFGDRLLEPEYGGRGTYYVNGEPCWQAFWRTLVVDCKCYPIQRLSPGDISKWGPAFLALMRDGELPKGRDGQAPEAGSRPLWRMLRRMVIYWTFTTTKEKGLYAMVLCVAREGDVIAVLDGAKVPVVLREVAGKQASEDGIGKFELVSTAYVHGFMDGEVYARAEDLGLKRQRFLLL